MTKQLREFDPVLVEAVERALGPYRGRLSPELIEHMREEALVHMATHPYPVALLGAVTKRKPVDRSGEVPRGGTAAAMEETGGGGRSEKARQGGGDE